MKETIEVIELNDGSIIVQDTGLKQAIYLGHKTNQSCKDSFPCLLKGEGIDGWDSGDHEQEFITDEVYAEQSQNGGLKILSDQDIKEILKTELR